MVKKKNLFFFIFIFDLTSDFIFSTVKTVSVAETAAAVKWESMGNGGPVPCGMMAGGQAMSSQMQDGLYGGPWGGYSGVQLAEYCAGVAAAREQMLRDMIARAWWHRQLQEQQYALAIQAGYTLPGMMPGDGLPSYAQQQVWSNFHLSKTIFLSFSKKKISFFSVHFMVWCSFNEGVTRPICFEEKKCA